MNTPLYCPGCTHPMRVFSHRGVTLEVCSSCGGGLLSPRGLEALLADRSDPSTWRDAGIASDVGASSLACPLHAPGAPMRLYRLCHGGHDLDLDLCTVCGSIWLDEGEGAQVEAIADALHAVEQRTTLVSLADMHASDAALIARFSDERHNPWPATIAMFAIFVALTVHRYLVPVDVYASLWGFVPAELGRGEHLHTLVTSAFAHAHLLHLFMNAIYFIAIGRRLEQYLGAKFVVALFVFSSIAGNLLYFASSPTSPIPSVGASAGVAGYLGALIVIAPRVELVRAGQNRVGLTVGLVAWLLWEVLMAFAGPSGVNHFAHVGGFAGGLAFAGSLHLLGLPKTVELTDDDLRVSTSRAALSKLGDLITEHPGVSIPLIGVAYLALTVLFMATMGG